MRYPEEFMYSKSHEWVKFLEDEKALVGITDYAQKTLGALVFAELPEPGDEVTLEESFADIESVKAVSNIYSPITGMIVEVNDQLVGAPEMINEDPYGAWMIKVENITEKGELMTAEEYKAFCENGEKR